MPDKKSDMTIFIKSGLSRDGPLSLGKIRDGFPPSQITLKNE
jgi:hypothetical protein